MRLGQLSGLFVSRKLLNLLDQFEEDENNNNNKGLKPAWRARGAQQKEVNIYANLNIIYSIGIRRKTN